MPYLRKMGFVLLALFAMPSAAPAQIRVGPFGGVGVNLPRVSVNVLPFGGGTRVVTPLGSVNTGIYGIGGGFYGGVGANFYRYESYSSFGSTGFLPYGGYSEYRSYRYDAAPGYSYGYESYAEPIIPPALYDAPVQSADPIYGMNRGVVPDGRLDLNPLPPSVSSGLSNTPSSIPSEQRLLDSAITLQRSIQRRRDDADVWMQYLAPDRIISTLRNGGDIGALAQLLPNYDGLAANSDLAWIWSMPGFRRTHNELRAFVASRAATDIPRDTNTPQAAPPQQEPRSVAAPNAPVFDAPTDEEPMPEPATNEGTESTKPSVKGDEVPEIEELPPARRRTDV
ncbi:MAG: hypothetical protein AAF664_24530 [Planctomycetota bacterium]